MKLPLLFLFLLIPFFLVAQTDAGILLRAQKRVQRKMKNDEMIRKQEEGTKLFNHANTFALRFNTDGYALAFNSIRYSSFDKASFWGVAFGERKERIQIREAISSNQNSVTNLAYGKINNFYMLKGEYGGRRLVGWMGNNNGASINFLYGGGLSLGFLKPYYVQVIDNRQGNQPVNIRYTNGGNVYNDSLFLNVASLVGPAGFYVGWSELKVVPGLHARSALQIDFSKSVDKITGVEFGVTADVYTQKMPMYYRIPAQRFFFNAYVSILFGKKK